MEQDNNDLRSEVTEVTQDKDTATSAAEEQMIPEDSPIMDQGDFYEEEPEITKPIKKSRLKMFSYAKGKKDIKYLGPLSYRAFLILGWLCIVLMHAGYVMTAASKADPTATTYETLSRIFSSLAQLSIPLILISNFAKILSSQDNYTKYLVQYGILSAFIFILSNMVYYRYILGFTDLIIANRAITDFLLNFLLSKAFHNGYLAYNVFIDLFMCTLFMFCVNYKPERFFKGKWILVLRFMALIPVAFEIASAVIQILSVNGQYMVPVWMYPLLSTKPPMMFIVFIILAFYIKRRERIFRKHGYTHDDFLRYLSTNRNSFQFSGYMSIVFVIVGLLDLLIAFFGAITIVAASNEAIGVELAVERMYSYGFGGSGILILLAPLMLLLSYTRKPRIRFSDMLVPYIAIILIIFVYLEAGYQFLLMNSSFFDGIRSLISKLLF